MSQVGASDRATCDSGSQMFTSEKSEEEKPQTGFTDKCSDDPHASTTSKCPDDEKSQVTTTNKSFGEEEPQVNVIEKSVDEPESQTGTPNKPVDQQPQISTTDRSGDQEAPTSTTDKSVEQVSTMGTTEKSSGQEPPTITYSSNEQKSPIGTTDKSSGQVSPTTITDNSVEQESHMGATDKSGGKSQRIADKSSGKEMPQVNSIDKSLDEPTSQTATADKSMQELPTSTTEKSGDKEAPTSTTDKSGYQKSQRSITDHSESITKKEDLQLDPTPYPRQRQVFQEGAASQPPPKSQTVIEEKPTTGYHWLIGPIISAMVVVVLIFVFSTKGQPPVHQDSVLEIFFKEFAKLKKDFPGQNEGLWFRSEKLLQKHLNMSDPSAPSILILTAAQDGEQTLRCVSQRLAKSYADSLSAKWLMVHGPSKSNFDSATSKMQIDEELSSGFQSGSRAAVLYRLETLPPGSLLILYKYCDHENAAFKNVALVLTILLDEQSLEMDLSFTEVEEKVKDFLWERFAYSGVTAHNEMDVDKLSGVWSRISHVVLPVLPVGSIESDSCPGIQDQH